MAAGQDERGQQRQQGVTNKGDAHGRILAVGGSRAKRRCAP
jgi:hypothetical protein